MKNSIVFLGRFILKEKFNFGVGLLFTSLVSALTWYGPKVIAHIIDEGLVPSNQSVIIKGIWLLAGLELARLLSIFLSQLAYAVLGQNVIEQVRKEMVSHLFKLPVPYFDRVSSGGMMTRIVSDVNALTDFFQSGFVSVLGNFASVFAIFFGLLEINFKLGFLLLLTFIPVATLCFVFSKKLKLVYEATRNRLSDLNSKLADFLFGMRTVRALGLGESKYSELNQNVREYADAQMKMVGTFALFHPTVSLGIGVMILLLIGHGLPLVASKTLMVGEWVAALSYVVLLQQPLVEISDRWNFFLAGITSIERTREIFRERPEVSGSSLAPKFEAIEFEGVSFRYPGSQVFSLSQVNFTLRQGDWIGIYGESGSGKSTFLQMLYGFYQPSNGSLKWNGKPFSSFNVTSLRSHFGVVEQFPFLFQGTIRENIELFGRFSLDLLEFREVFRGYPLIESLLQMPDFEISERGENLSMGQKQMITFLRAYLAKPEVWVLDEATAFFDHEAEAEVLRALQVLSKNAITVIQVAHRPEALARMSRLLQVDRGMVLETPPPLLSRSKDSQ